jgi:hypothetical protein
MLKQYQMNDFEAIEKYYTGEITIEKLSDKQRDIFDRLDYCDNLLRSSLVQSDGAVAKQMHRHFKVKFPSYTLRTAYKDIEKTKTIHKSISRIDKDYEKIRMIRHLDWALMEAQKPPVNLREFNSALALKIKLLGLDKLDDNSIPWDKLVSPAFYMQINVSGSNGPLLDINELMKIKGTVKEGVMRTIEDANVIDDPGTFLDVDNEQ